MENVPDRFERASESPIYWHNSSTDLRGAAAAVWSSMNDGWGSEIAAKYGLGEWFDLRIAALPVYEMLCGMSLELLYKAIAVAKGKEVLSHHKLNELARHAGLEVNIRDTGLLEVLTEAIRWSGRYPIPLNRRDWEKTWELRDKHLFKKIGQSPVLTPGNDLNWRSFTELWLAADGVYWKHHRNP